MGSSDVLPLRSLGMSVFTKSTFVYGSSSVPDLRLWLRS
jgi:hypothetical protein